MWRGIALQAIAVVTALFLSRPGSAETVAAMKWKYRPILVFAKNDGDELLRQQRSIFADASEALRQRQVAVIYVTGDRSTSSETASDLRAKYGVEPQDFRVVLIGKDGGVKRNSRRPITVSQLSSTIDAMPMRKQEMRRE